MLGKLFTNTKDKAVSVAVQKAINYKIEEFGEMLKFNLNSKAKTIDLEIMLNGESEPLYVQIKKYVLTQEDDKHYLEARDIVTSREWINIVASQYLSNQRFAIPSEYAKMLKMVV